MQTCYEKCRVLHRSVNSGSLMFKAQPHGWSGMREGVLIDFNLAPHVAEPDRTVTGERSRTMPFDAIDTIMAWIEVVYTSGFENSFTDVPHSLAHDLESIFYVFCWICTVIAGPNFTPGP